MEYKIEPCEFDNGEKYLTIVFNDPSLLPLHPFIVNDFTPFFKEYIEIFDNVLSGKVEKESASGNACYFEADKENTFVDFLFPEDENKRECCTVNTRELRTLMDEWLKAREEFLKTKEE